MNRFAWLPLCTPVAARLPWAVYAGASVAGETLWQVRRRGRSQLIANLLPFCDDSPTVAKRAARQARRNVARYWVEVAARPAVDLERFERDRVRIAGAEKLRMLETPGPVVVLGAHTGNGELCLQLSVLGSRPRIALVEPLAPPDFAQAIFALRAAGIVQFHEATFAGLRRCAMALKEGGLVGMMGDRDLSGGGIPVKLAGRHVRIARGPWQLAWRHHAVVLPVFCSREHRNTFEVRVEEPVQICRSGTEEAGIADAAQRWATRLEAHLRRDPGQWLVQEDFWNVHACSGD